MKRAFIKGNDAIILGALAAGCRAFFGYPITPASEIAHDAMKYFPQVGALAIQAESEVSAINMLYGAGACGELAMTATSGPGFSLMQEGISYMAAAGIPGVIVDIMRSGPGLGNIGPEQSDYWMAVRGGGHGHYHMAVFAPASVSEMYQMTQSAFKAAFKYRSPVCVLADAFIGQMMETMDLPDVLAQIPEALNYPLPNAVTGSPDTMGNIISSLELVSSKLEYKNDKRFDIYHQMTLDLPDAEINDPQPDEPLDILVIAFGICARLAAEAIDNVRNNGLRVCLMRPKLLWPWPENMLKEQLKRTHHILVIECNRGMMQQDVERFADSALITSINHDGGILPSVCEIEEKLLQIVSIQSHQV